jgi:cell division protein FtsW (lipid II flippase)
MFLRVLPSLTVLVGIALGVLSVSPDRNVLAPLLPSLVLAAVAPLAASLALSLFASGSDPVLVCTAGMLTAVGLVNLFLASLAPSQGQQFMIEIVLRQGIFIGVGFVAMVAGALLVSHIERLSHYPYVLLSFGLALTIVTAVVGQTVNGARLWLRVGPFQFQPSELTRLLVAIFAARYVYVHRHHIGAPWRIGVPSTPSLAYALPLFGAIAAAASVLVLQADLGMASLIILSAFLTFAAIQRSRAALVLAAIGLVVAIAGAAATTQRVRERVLAWLDPWQDPAGRGFQLLQADYSLALGGTFGVLPPKIGAVPEVHTDLILVAIGNEFGWLGTIGTLAMLSILVCRCASIALRAGSGFAPLLILSVAAILGIQIILIVGGTIRALPLTGLTLPLVSYGGTSMISTLFMLGVVLGFGHRAKSA